MVSEALNFFVLCLKHHFNKSHFSFFLDQFVSIFLILVSFCWYSESINFLHLDFALNLRVNCKGAWLDFCLTELAEATFARRSIFLPNAQVLSCFFVVNLTLLLICFKGENQVVWWHLKGICRLSVCRLASCIAAIVSLPLVILFVVGHLRFAIWHVITFFVVDSKRPLTFFKFELFLQI